MKKHGKRHTRVYKSWQHMKDRCLNQNHPKYHRYGGRGITICKEWMNFAGFYADMGDPPEGLTLDRRDNECGYFVENCRWATPKQQCNNKQNNNSVTHNGITLNETQWADRLGIPRTTIYNRLHVLGWDVDRALASAKEEV